MADEPTRDRLDPPTPARIRQPIVLIGLRASGKTTVGAALARLLDADFIDLDDQTRVRLGAPTAGEAFLRAGEPAFRDAEADALSEELARHDRSGSPRELVLALGGGTPTGARAGTLIREARDRGRIRVVFLDPPLEVLVDRLRRHEGDRPSLTGRGVIDEVPEVAEARRPLYAALADLAVRDSSSVVKVAERIAASLATGAAGASGAAGRSQR